MPESEVVVITFDDEVQAGAALKSLRSVERSGNLQLEDTAVIVKHPNGKVGVQNEVSGAVETGAVVGGLLGMFMLFMFPFAGLALGAAGGALVGKLMNSGVDAQFVKDV